MMQNCCSQSCRASRPRDKCIATHGTGQQYQQWRKQQLIDGFINVMLPSHISVIIFYWTWANAYNKITETAADSQFSVILFCFIILLQMGEWLTWVNNSVNWACGRWVTVGLLSLRCCCLFDVQKICENLNDRHRMAQYAGRASVALHTQVYVLSFASYLQSSLHAASLPSARQRPSYGDYLEVNREYYQNSYVRRGSFLELYYCNMVEWFWWYLSLLWNCWLGHLACKNHPWNDL